MADERLAYQPATKLLKLIASKQVSPVELMETFLARIDRLDPQIASFRVDRTQAPRVLIRWPPPMRYYPRPIPVTVQT